MKNEKQICQECEEEQSVHYCLECDEKLCESCSKILHSFKKRQNHHFEEEKEIFMESKRNGNCDFHQSEKIIAYCETCFELCCFECLKLQNHKEHQMVELVEDLSSNYDKIKEIYQSCFNVFVETEKKFKSDEEKSIQEILNYFKGLRSCLDLKEEEMLSDLKEKFKNNFEILANEKLKLEAISFDKNNVYEKLKFFKFVRKVLRDLYDHRNRNLNLANSISFLHHENLEKIINESSNIFEEMTEETALQRKLSTFLLFNL
jgi:hypothetical protein